MIRGVNLLALVVVLTALGKLKPVVDTRCAD